MLDPPKLTESRGGAGLGRGVGGGGAGRGLIQVAAFRLQERVLAAVSRPRRLLIGETTVASLPLTSWAFKTKVRRC